MNQAKVYPTLNTLNSRLYTFRLTYSGANSIVIWNFDWIVRSNEQEQEKLFCVKDCVVPF